jgi:hypothetical protein
MDKPHKKLKAWQLAVDIAEKIYAITQSFPDDEKFGLVRQMRKCAVNIVAFRRRTIDAWTE